MKTRNLLLLSAACGLAIIIAGVFLFLRVGSRPSATLLSHGESARIGDMTVVVTSVSASTEGTEVGVTMRGVIGESVLDGWRLLGDGRLLSASGATGDGFCGVDSTVADVGTTCVLRFPAVDVVQAVAYTRAGEQRQWAP